MIIRGPSWFIRNISKIEKYSKAKEREESKSKAKQKKRSINVTNDEKNTLESA
tara:strand:+ start:209 stop:367 length:159 start_codon:yes stop_codon:yes gene_type:complete